MRERNNPLVWCQYPYRHNRPRNEKPKVKEWVTFWNFWLKWKWFTYPRHYSSLPLFSTTRHKFIVKHNFWRPVMEPNDTKQLFSKSLTLLANFHSALMNSIHYQRGIVIVSLTKLWILGVTIASILKRHAQQSIMTQLLWEYPISSS